jgi:hypothetical protein
MSVLDKLKNVAKRQAQQHPQQVHQAEQEAEKRGKDFLGKGSGGQQHEDDSGGGKPQDQGQ